MSWIPASLKAGDEVAIESDCSGRRTYVMTKVAHVDILGSIGLYTNDVFRRDGTPAVLPRNGSCRLVQPTAEIRQLAAEATPDA